MPGLPDFARGAEVGSVVRIDDAHGVWKLGDHVGTSRVAKAGRPPADEGPVARAYETWAAELRRFATSRTHDAATAEDVVQDAFLRLAIQARTSGNPGNPKAWLYRVVLNLIISGARHAEVARRHSPALAVEEHLADPAEALILTSERNHALGAALGVLGAASRTSLLLAAEGYTGREIGEVLGRSEGATRTIICRARKAVRQELVENRAQFAAD
jgi:RNA polymerase sigma factor (sigma-70 family)